MPPVSIERWVARYIARLQFGQFLQRAAEFWAGGLFALGLSVLVSKLVWPQLWPHVLWLALGLVPIGVLAWWLSTRERWTRSESVARLDSALDTGGLLMTLCERGGAATDWAQQLPQIEKWQGALPRLRPKRFFGLLTLPALFALGACLVPVREAASQPSIGASVSQLATQELEELIDLAQQDKVLEEQEEQKLREEMERLAEETKDRPLTQEKWEAIDALRERLQLRVETAGVEYGKALQLAMEIHDAQQGDGGVPAEQVEEMRKQLAETLKKMSDRGAFSKASPELQKALERLMKQGPNSEFSGDPRELQESLDDLMEHLAKERKRLAEIRKRCKSCTGSECEEGECDGEGNCQKEGTCKSGRPGSGGVTRGRGDAPLTFQDDSELDGTKFKEIVLPRGIPDMPSDEVLKVERAAPEVDPAAQVGAMAAREVGPATGASAWSRKLNPRHRNVVRHYFESK